MNSMTTNWEDEENNRLVELSVTYRIDNDRLEIDAITPTSISFFDPQTKQFDRKIKVWTEAGRQLISRTYQQHIGTDRLRLQIEDELLAGAR